MKITSFNQSHYDRIAEIYREGIATGLATFQTTVTDWNEWNAGHLQSCRLAAFENDELIGWAALSPVSSRCVYGGVAEVSIYISKEHQGKGIGKRLLTQLIAISEAAGIWTLQSGIFPENTPSIQLHKSCGFRLVGYREKIGQYNGQWRDTVLLERRSIEIGK